MDINGFINLRIKPVLRAIYVVVHGGQAVFVKDSYFKSEFHFHVQFEFFNFKFISTFISFEN